MTFKVIAEADAKREWNEAVEWYEKRTPGLGLRFNHDLRLFLQSLASRPERFRPFTRSTRKATVPRPWPYSVYFVINTERREVNVLAIWHGRRSPEALWRRLK